MGWKRRLLEFDAGSGKAVGIEEKPETPRSNWAVTGLYFYDSTVCDRVRDLRPSKRVELEITDLNRMYLQQRLMHVERMGRGFAWLDTGTHASLLQASNFIEAIEQRQGLKVARLEEIALAQGWIGAEEVRRRASVMANSEYGQYLNALMQAR